MPGISNLNDREFIRAFQVMDRVVQNNQPIFMLVWVGSVVALVTAAVLGIGQLDGAERLLIILNRTGFLRDLITWEDGVYGTSKSVFSGGA